MRIDPVVAHLLADKTAIRSRFEQYLRMASVSTDPAHAPAMQDAREFLLRRLDEMGLSNVRLLGVDSGEPAVYAEWLGATGAPTVLIYGHYDVQPAGPLELWTTPPFEPSERDGRIYARGASDVKGSTLIALETIGAFLAVEGSCPINVKVFIEGEEETGSPSLPEIVSRHSGLLAADAMISADGGRGSLTVPTINMGIRGLARMDITLFTAQKDAHSGKYGGAVRNALHEMAALISTLHDQNGAVAVRDFASDAEPITEERRLETAALQVDETQFLRDIGASAAGDPAFTLRERLTLMPCIDVNGLWGGYTGVGSMTVIPQRASAKLTMRLAAGQSPARALERVEAHMRSHLRLGCVLVVDVSEAIAPAYQLRRDHPLVVSAQKVMRATSGQEPVLMRHAATVPIVSFFKEKLGLDTLMFGFHLPDEDIHAPNEFFRLSSFDDGFVAWPLLLRELADHDSTSMRD